MTGKANLRPRWDTARLGSSPRWSTEPILSLRRRRGGRSLPDAATRGSPGTYRSRLQSWPWSQRLRLRFPRPLARPGRAVAPPGSHLTVEGLPRYSPKLPFLMISLVAAPTPSSPQPASAALGLIAAIRIGLHVDSRTRLATGATVGRATTIPRCSDSSARIRSGSAGEMSISMRTS